MKDKKLQLKLVINYLQNTIGSLFGIADLHVVKRENYDMDNITLTSFRVYFVMNGGVHMHFDGINWWESYYSDNHSGCSHGNTTLCKLLELGYLRRIKKEM